MLNELISKVCEKTGIPHETAASAVTTVVDFLKKRLPEPIASHLDTFLEGGENPSNAAGDAKGAASDLLNDAKDAFGSLFNKK